MKKLIKIINLFNKNNIKYDLEIINKNIIIYINNRSLNIDLNNNLYINYEYNNILHSRLIKFNELILIFNLI